MAALPPSRSPAPGWPNIALMSAGHFMSDFFTHILPVLLPLLCVQFDISYSQCAFLFTVFSVVSYVLQPGIGILADRSRITRLLPWSIAVSAVFTCIVGWFSSYWLLVAVLMISGLSAAFFHPLSAGVVPTIYPRSRRGLAVSIYIAGGNLGAALAPLVTAAFITAFSTESLVALAVPALITALLMALRHLDRRPIIKHSLRPGETGLLHLVKSRSYVLLNLSICSRSLPHAAFITFLPLLYSSLGYSAAEGAAAMFLFMLGTAAGGLISGSLADRYSLKTLLACSYVLLFAFALLFFLRADNSILSYALLFLTGASTYPAVSLGVIWGQRLMPDHAAFAASMMLGFSFAVGFLLTPLTGFIADHTDLLYAMYWSTLPAAALSLIIILLVQAPPKPQA